MTEDERVRWHYGLNGHEFEQAPGDGEGQGRLECCSPWSLKESDLTERLDNNNILFQAKMLKVLQIKAYVSNDRDIERLETDSVVGK